jgi:hypothetical protein
VRNDPLARAIVCVLALMTWQGCNTCRPDQPAVRPQVGGTVGVGSGGVWHGSGLGLDVSNLFCRSQDPETTPQPGPGSPPIQDPATQAPSKPTEDDAR